jgi:hypothetical protein
MVGSLLPLQITEQVSSRKCGKIISHQCKWAFHYQFSAACALWIGMCQIVLLKPLKSFFLFFEEQVTCKIKNKISAV